MQKFKKPKHYFGCAFDLEPKTKEEIKRQNKFFNQLKNRGWDDTETWSLYYVLAKLIHPRLKRLRDCHAGHPMFSNKSRKGDPEKWNAILDKMIEAFNLIILAEDDKTKELEHYKYAFTDEYHKKVKEGLNLFAKWFLHLWD